MYHVMVTITSVQIIFMYNDNMLKKKVYDHLLDF